MRKTIFFRNFFSTAAIVFVSFAMLGAVFASLSYRFMYNSRRDEMLHMAQEATNNVSALSSMWTTDSLEMKMVLTNTLTVCTWENRFPQMYCMRPRTMTVGI